LVWAALGYYGQIFHGNPTTTIVLKAKLMPVEYQHQRTFYGTIVDVTKTVLGEVRGKFTNCVKFAAKSVFL